MEFNAQASHFGGLDDEMVLARLLLLSVINQLVGKLIPMANFAAEPGILFRLVDCVLKIQKKFLLDVSAPMFLNIFFLCFSQFVFVRPIAMH